MFTNKRSRVQPRRKRVATELRNRKSNQKTARTSSDTMNGSAHRGESSKSEPAGRELWIAEKTSLSRQKDMVPWSTHLPATSDARLLELADIALGVRKPQPFRRRRSLFLAAQQQSN